MSRAIPSTFTIPTHYVCFGCSYYTSDKYTHHGAAYCGSCFHKLQKLLKGQE